MVWLKEFFKIKSYLILNKKFIDGDWNGVVLFGDLVSWGFGLLFFTLVVNLDSKFGLVLFGLCCNFFFSGWVCKVWFLGKEGFFLGEVVS